MVIHNERLLEIANRIISEPGFSTDGQGLLRAHERWVKLTEPEERLAAERALFLRWLEDLRAERRRGHLPLPLPESRIDRLKAIPPVQVGDVQPETALPVSELRFRSESPEWPADDSPGGHTTNDIQRVDAAGDQASVPAMLHTTPIGVSPVRANTPPRLPAPVTITSIAAVQQPSRKVAAYQQMFPELTFPVQAASGAKPLAEFTEADIDYRIGQLRDQRQAWRTANAGDEDRIEERERLNVRDRVRIAERRQNIGDTEGEEVRLAAAKREVAESGCAVIGDLPLEVLAACGFKRRVA